MSQQRHRIPIAPTCRSPAKSAIRQIIKPSQQLHQSLAAAHRGPASSPDLTANRLAAATSALNRCNRVNSAAAGTTGLITLVPIDLSPTPCQARQQSAEQNGSALTCATIPGTELVFAGSLRKPPH